MGAVISIDQTADEHGPHKNCMYEMRQLMKNISIPWSEDVTFKREKTIVIVCINVSRAALSFVQPSYW